MIYICSPLIDVDYFWIPVKTRNNMKAQHTDDDPIFVSHYDSDALHEMLDTQHKKNRTRQE